MGTKTVDPAQLYDAVIIGGGPAGLTAALYLARAQYRVLVVEKDHFGGQITITEEVVNYPGRRKTSGAELAETMRRQAEAFGAEFLLAEAERLEMEGDIKHVVTNRGTFACFGILLATGAHPRKVGFLGEETYQGRGVAYCATCDGAFFAGKDVFVIGGGFAAAEESVFLTRFARKVTILIRGEDFSCAASAAEKARQNEKITVLTHTTVEEVSGESGLNYIRYKNAQTGAVTEFRAENGEIFGVFVFAGYEPATALIDGLAECDAQGYVITDTCFQTSTTGLYAAGDVCIKPLRQVATAVGDGALAATALEEYAAKMQRKTGLHPTPPTARQNEETAPTVTAPADGNGALFSDEMKAQLADIFSRMERPLVLKLWLNDQPVSAELENYMTTLANSTEKLHLEVADRNSQEEGTPMVRICYEDGRESGLAFHGVPGGHEFTSFVLGLYNAAGPGQSLDTETMQEMDALHTDVHLKILVSLSCTMCPELVTAVQHIAARNPHISAEVYDVNHFPALRERYNVMSVPCLVVNDSKVFFGRKNIREVLALLHTAL